jgi:5'-methylthioadenosine phosphorylase
MIEAQKHAPLTLAVLGGSGLYEMEGLSGVAELRIDTPFGPPSDVIIEGRLGDTRLLFLPRHGRGHRIPPNAINYRANICALKRAGATHLMTVSAVGSMKEEIAPGDLVVVDQFIDLTKRRVSTFFEDEVAAHVGFADPVCELMTASVADAADRAVKGHGSSRAKRSSPSRRSPSPPTTTAGTRARRT